jgi:hypothetical protein
MSTDTKPRKKLYSLAAAIGLALGSMGVAAAASSPSQAAPTVAPTQQQSSAVANDQGSAPTGEATEAETEAPGDETVDGVDHQFEGEEIGNNGDGVPDANEAAETVEAGTNG